MRRPSQRPSLSPLSYDKRGWHVGREISLPGIFILMLQTVAFVWWLATLNATVAGLVSANMELKTRLEGINSTVITPAIQTASRLDVVIAKIEAQEKQINSISMEVQTLRLEIGKTGRR